MGRLASPVPEGKKWAMERFVLLCAYTKVASMSSGSLTWLQSDSGDMRRINSLWYCGPVLCLTRGNPDDFLPMHQVAQALMRESRLLHSFLLGII